MGVNVTRRMAVWRVLTLKTKKSMFPYFTYLVLPYPTLNLKVVKYWFVIHLVAFTLRMVRETGNSHIRTKDRSSLSRSVRGALHLSDVSW